VRGFAFIAWPAEYGETGVMSFILSRDSGPYQADLGTGSAAIASQIDSFDPGREWSSVSPFFTYLDDSDSVLQNDKRPDKVMSPRALYSSKHW